ncbi:Fc.00g000870.m01.CDS01 [Cosmosporella sp. VM-42]
MTVPAKKKFPSDPILTKLLQAAKETGNGRPIVHDAHGFVKNYSQLLGDILQTRDLIRQNLPPSVINDRGILHEETPYICVLALSGYEFLVAFFAIRALGGACIPFSSGILPEEAWYFLSNAKSTCLLTGRGRTEQAGKIAVYAQEQGKTGITALPISCDAKPVDMNDLEVDGSLQVDSASPGLVLFTSGTTGPPKGAVLPKRCFAFQYMAKAGSASINYRPSHWIGGAEGLIEPLVTGAQVHAVKERAGAQEVWEIFKNYEINHVLFTPTLLRTMKEFYVEHITELPHEEREKYINGFRKMSKIACCSAMIAPSTLRFWVDLTGVPFENVYGSTEMGGAAMRASIHTRVKFSIGNPCPGVKIKLSKGDHGEIRCKNDWMITHYIGDAEATRSAFDEDGYFKTGDLAQIEDGEHVFTGRATSDYVFFHGYRISTLRVQNSLTDLPYISDAYVVGVPDHEAKELCGAVLRIKKDAVNTEQVSLARIRLDLMGGLPTYMLPVLLRILSDEEDVPRTVSQKPIKKRILQELFGITDYWSVDNPNPKVESWGNQPEQIQAKTRPWDWCGLQRAD